MYDMYPGTWREPDPEWPTEPRDTPGDVLRCEECLRPLEDAACTYCGSERATFDPSAASVDYSGRSTLHHPGVFSYTQPLCGAETGAVVVGPYSAITCTSCKAIISAAQVEG